MVAAARCVPGYPAGPCSHLRIGLLELAAVCRGDGLPPPVNVLLHLTRPNTAQQAGGC